MNLKSMMKEYGIPETVTGTCSLEGIEKNKVTFLADISYKKFLKKNQGIVVFTSKKIYEEVKSNDGNTFIIVDNPHHAFIEFHNEFHRDFQPLHTGNSQPLQGKNCRIDASAKFGSNVKLGSNVTIFPNVVIGSNVAIGDNTSILPSVSIYDNVSIGKNCFIDAGAAIGGEGFSTVCSKEHGAMRLKNIGGVKIGDFVEIGNNSSIDRASFLFTEIGDRVLIDNVVHIAHNVKIGEDTRMAAMSCVGGGSTIGKRVWIGIGCSIKEHVDIGNDCFLSINSVVVSSVKKNERVGGFYAMPHQSWLGHMKDIYKNYVLKTDKTS